MQTTFFVVLVNLRFFGQRGGIYSDFNSKTYHRSMLRYLLFMVKKMIKTKLKTHGYSQSLCKLFNETRELSYSL